MTSFYNPLHHHPDSPACLARGQRADRYNSAHNQAEDVAFDTHQMALADLIANDPLGFISDLKREITGIVESFDDGMVTEIQDKMDFPDNLDEADIYQLLEPRKDDLIDVLMKVVADHLSSQRNDGRKYKIIAEEVMPDAMG